MEVDIGYGNAYLCPRSDVEFVYEGLESYSMTLAAIAPLDIGQGEWL